MEYECRYLFESQVKNKTLNDWEKALLDTTNATINVTNIESMTDKQFSEYINS